MLSLVDRERYRDFLEASSTILKMNSSAQIVESSLEEVQISCEENNWRDVFLKTSVGDDGPLSF
jgi:hypothetical protein